MSNFQAPTIHPVTKKVELATWLDNYFGHHQYGVQFSDGIYNADLMKIKPKNEDEIS